MNQMSLEINPSSCVIFVGPDIFTQAGRKAPLLSYRSLLQAGIDLCKDERGWLQQKLVHQDSDTTQELVRTLTGKKLTEQWLNEYLSPRTADERTIQHDDQLLQLLLDLQSKGCRLVYTFYDNYLDRLLDTEPILLTNNDHMEKWLNGQIDGLFHIYGSISDMSSIILYNCTTSILTKQQQLFVQLKEMLTHKSLLFIGHQDLTQMHTLLVETVHLFLQEDNVIKNPPLCLSSLPHSSIPDCFLHVPVDTYHQPEATLLHKLIIISNDSLFMTGKVADKTLDKESTRSQAVLIFSEKQSFRKLGDIIYHLNKSGEIYVRRDALTIIFGARIMYGNILTYGGKGLHQIWDLILPKGSVLQNKGLVAIGLQSSCLIWIAGKPLGLGSITDVTTFHSLWNNSVSAINHSNKPATLTTSPCSSSGDSPSLATVPSLPALVPINFIPNYSSLLRGVTPTAVTGNFLVPSLSPQTGQLILSTPSTSLPGTSVIQQTKTGEITGTGLPSTGMSLPSTGMSLPGTGMSLPNTGMSLSSTGMSLSSTGMSLPSAGMSLPSAGMSLPSAGMNLLSAGMSLPNIGMNLPGMCLPNTGLSLLNIGTTNLPSTGITLAPTTRISLPPPPSTIGITTTVTSPTTTTSSNSVSTDTSTGMSPPDNSTRMSPSSTTDKRTRSDSDLYDLPTTAKLLKADPPLTIEVTTQRILADHESPISVIEQPPLPSLTTTPRLPTPTIIGQLPRQPMSLLTYPRLSFIPLPIASQRSPFQIVSPLGGQIMSPSLAPSLSTFPFNNRILNNVNITTTPAVVTPSRVATIRVSTSSTAPQKETSDSQTMPVISSTTNSNIIPAITPYLSSISGSSCSSNSINHLWQFLLRLLLIPNHGHIIQWTGQGYEFCITDSTRLTEMWAEVSQNPTLTFHGLMGELRSYTGLGILEKVEGKELTYQFTMDIQTYLSIHAGTLSKEL